MAEAEAVADAEALWLTLAESVDAAPALVLPVAAAVVAAEVSVSVLPPQAARLSAAAARAAARDVVRLAGMGSSPL
ncbi:hypothetical protein GCM10028781_05640 [Nostocoides australiense]